MFVDCDHFDTHVVGGALDRSLPASSGAAVSSNLPEGSTRQTPDATAPRNIADEYRDLMCYLTAAQRRGLTSRLATGYYEGWRPSRDELADLVAVELGVLTVEESSERMRARRRGKSPASIIGFLGRGRQYLHEGTR
jgi:hypothetical protein